MATHIGQFALDAGWFIFLLCVLVYFLRDRRALLRTQSWMKTKGRITHCEWVSVGHSLWPKIEYSYQVNEQDLVGQHLFLDTAHNNPNSHYARNMAYKVAIAYKEQTEIDVYYNPNRPEQSALDVSIPLKLKIIIALISTFIVMQVGLMVIHLSNGLLH